jgi:hypothetical protein
MSKALILDVEETFNIQDFDIEETFNIGCCKVPDHAASVHLSKTPNCIQVATYFLKSRQIPSLCPSVPAPCS